MPIDTTVIPALERELEMARHTRGGGQAPDPARIKAIEDQLRLTRAAAGRPMTAQETADEVVVDQVENADAPTTEKAVVNAKTEKAA